MKNTNYILHDSLSFDGFGVIAIPAAFVALPIMSAMFVAAMMMDGGRVVKMEYLLFKRQQRNLNYIKCVLRSLNCEVTQGNIEMLKVA